MFAMPAVLSSHTQGTVRFIIPDSATMSESEILEYILLRQQVITDKSEIESLIIVKITADDIKKDLSQFETISLFKNYKFGVMYVAADQTTEQQILSNRKSSAPLNVFTCISPQNIQVPSFSRSWTHSQTALSSKDSRVIAVGSTCFVRSLVIVLRILTYSCIRRHYGQRVVLHRIQWLWDYVPRSAVLAVQSCRSPTTGAKTSHR